MYEDYVFSEKDKEAIEEALTYLDKKELNFVFADRSAINSVLVISFDSSHLYLWVRSGSSARRGTGTLSEIPCKTKGYKAYKLPHNLDIKDEYYRGWRASARPVEITDILPKYLHSNPKISGGPLLPFTQIHKTQQKSGQRPLDPYCTKESYLATIIHEFGHVYYSQHRLWYFGNKSENLGYLKTALELYENKRPANLKSIIVRFPVYKGTTEVYATCTEYFASSLFWPTHKNALDRELAGKIGEAIKEEKDIDLTKEDSQLSKNTHLMSAALGKIMMKQHPKDWPKVILTRS
jgi:hypothetical protein